MSSFRFVDIESTQFSEVISGGMVVNAEKFEGLLVSLGVPFISCLHFIEIIIFRRLCLLHPTSPWQIELVRSSEGWSQSRSDSRESLQWEFDWELMC